MTAPSANGRDRIAQVKAQGVARVAAALGFTVGMRGLRSGFVTPCPVCGEATRHHKSQDKRGAVGLTPDGGGCRCHQCGEGGSAFDFAAFAILRRRAQRGDLAAVLSECAAVGLCEPLPGEAPRVAYSPPLPVAAPPAPAQRPPGAELATFWATHHGLTDVPSNVAPEWAGAARAYLCHRGSPPDLLSMSGIDVRVAPADRDAYPAWWPSAWATSNRVALPAYDAHGTLVSIHARAIDNAKPKTRWPMGFSAGGLLMANCRGLAFLRSPGTWPVNGGAIIIAEGLTDTLRWSVEVAREPEPHAVLGIVSGSDSAFAAIDWPRDVLCWVATDADEAGDAYAQRIADHLVPKGVTVERIDLRAAAAPEVAL